MHTTSNSLSTTPISSSNPSLIQQSPILTAPSSHTPEQSNPLSKTTLYSLFRESCLNPHMFNNPSNSSQQPSSPIATYPQIQSSFQNPFNFSNQCILFEEEKEIAAEMCSATQLHKKSKHPFQTEDDIQEFLPAAKKIKSKNNKEVASKNKNRKLIAKPIKLLTTELEETAKTVFPPKGQFRSIIFGISKIENYSSELQKKEYTECVNQIFQIFLSTKWKERFTQALSQNYKNQRVLFLKKEIVPLLSPITAKALDEILDAHKPGGTEVLRDALDDFSWFEINKGTNPSLNALLNIVIQYAKNLFGKIYVSNTSSYLTEINDLFTKLNEKKVKILRNALKDISIDDLVLLSQYLPKLESYVNAEIAIRIIFKLN